MPIMVFKADMFSNVNVGKFNLLFGHRTALIPSRISVVATSA